MAYKKKTGGRKVGGRNLIPGEIKEMIIQALHNKGGVEYLEKQADKNPTAFMTLIGKVLPLSMEPSEGGKLTITWEK